MVGPGGTLRGCGDLLWVMVMPPEGDRETSKLNFCWALIRDEATSPCSGFSHSPSQASNTSTFPPKAPLGERRWGAELCRHSVGVHCGFSGGESWGTELTPPGTVGPVWSTGTLIFSWGAPRGKTTCAPHFCPPSALGTPKPQQAPALLRKTQQGFGGWHCPACAILCARVSGTCGDGMGTGDLLPISPVNFHPPLPSPLSPPTLIPIKNRTQLKRNLATTPLAG